MLLCLLVVLLMSSCISAMPSTGATLDEAGMVRMHGILPSPPMFARHARTLRNGNGPAVLIHI
ncbi:MAG TPA: hypothetical protein VMM15_10870 [Bradyrhizobium sp.]|nr:hypothetical protein [Bradyrhizobium sp.]